MAAELAQINLVKAYPLTAQEIEMWARTISELNPLITPDKLKFIIDKFKLDELRYDPSKGVQNIFRGFRVYFTKH